VQRQAVTGVVDGVVASPTVVRKVGVCQLDTLAVGVAGVVADWLEGTILAVASLEVVAQSRARGEQLAAVDVEIARGSRIKIHLVENASDALARDGNMPFFQLVAFFDKVERVLGYGCLTRP